MESENGDVKHDYAALILSKPIGEETGYFGLLEPNISDLENHKIHVTGYPALTNVEWGTAKGMMHDAALFKTLEEGVLKHGADASFGNSGSALYLYEHNNPNLEPHIVGVHSGGVPGRNYNHGPCMMGTVYNHVLDWIEEGKRYLETNGSV